MTKYIEHKLHPSGGIDKWGDLPRETHGFVFTGRNHCIYWRDATALECLWVKNALAAYPRDQRPQLDPDDKIWLPEITGYTANSGGGTIRNG